MADRSGLVQQQASDPPVAGFRMAGPAWSPSLLFGPRASRREPASARGEYHCPVGSKAKPLRREQARSQPITPGEIENS